MSFQSRTRDRLRSFLTRRDSTFFTLRIRTLLSFFLLGVINNVLYVVILSAALDLVGATTPKSIVLVANILPSVLVKCFAPYVFEYIGYGARVTFVVVLNVIGMVLVATAPSASSSSSSPSAFSSAIPGTGPPSGLGSSDGSGPGPGLGLGLAVKLLGIAMGSFASGAGEITFLQVSHAYPAETYGNALAAWASGTGGAGILGGVMYVAATVWLRVTPQHTLLFSSLLPLIMAVTFFVLLPKPGRGVKYATVDSGDEVGDEDGDGDLEADDEETNEYSTQTRSPARWTFTSISSRMALVKPLIMPYMLPLFLVYFAEYTINQGVSPTLLFPISETPFKEYRDIYPTYATLYQVGVFISRSSSPFIRVRQASGLYVASLMQCVILCVMIVQALYVPIPRIGPIFVIVVIEGLLGGLVYVNAFHNVSDAVDIKEEDKEFSIGSVGLADSLGVLCAAIFSIWLEPTLCAYQVRHGRPWCRES